MLYINVIWKGMIKKKKERKFLLGEDICFRVHFRRIKCLEMASVLGLREPGENSLGLVGNEIHWIKHIIL